MRSRIAEKSLILLLAALVMTAPALSACSGSQSGSDEIDTSDFINTVWDEPVTTDFQCTNIDYDTAFVVFDRLVSTVAEHDGTVTTAPSLAESWTVSSDGRIYTFHLREGVRFSNGSDLTSSDVRYTFERLLTYPDSQNREVALSILGAEALENGRAESLEGFREISDLDFSITLSAPFEAFLSCLSMPGASILDKETTEEAGELFGHDVEHTIGTGSFILGEWKPGKGMLFTANKDCWKGAPASDGLNVSFKKDAATMREMFDAGDLDIMDLDDLDNTADYYLYGDIYQDRLHRAPQVGITYVALNESIAPLDDVRVRKALQYATDRSMLLEVIYDDAGTVENGIYARGLYGYDPSLETIPYDPEQAKTLLAHAGYPGGFDLTISVRSDATQREAKMARMIAGMWEKIGVNADVVVVESSDFMDLRKKSELACYAATWIADYNDPDNFIYTFFGDREKTTGRSLCYPDEDIMARVRRARTITDPDKRIKEYRTLEKKIVQEDAAWIPLFSREKVYVTSERLDGFTTTWSGTFYEKLPEMSVKKDE